MITSCETQEFVPFGRGFTRNHPGQAAELTSNGNSSNKEGGRKSCGGLNANHDQATPLTRSFRDISLQEPILHQKESWVFRKHKDSTQTHDEELYVRGATVVWSRGGQDGARTIVKTFTMDNRVEQALWGTFVLSSGEQSIDCRSAMGSSGSEQNGVCVMTADTVTFFMESGGEYVTPMPFQVSRTWTINKGLLIERSLTNADRASHKKSSPNQTVLFSLLHPLDDVAPVITKVSSAKGPPKVSHLTDNNMTLIFTSCEPSIALSYDSVAGQHSVWKIRRARQEEVEQLGPTYDGNTSLHNMTPLYGNSNGGLSNSFSSRQMSNVSGMFPPGPFSSSSSPLRGFSGKVMSPSGVLRSSPGLGAMQSMPSTSPGAALTMRSSPGFSLRTLHLFPSRAQHSPSGNGSSAAPSASAPALYRFQTPPAPQHHQSSPVARCSPGRLMFSHGPANHSGNWGSGANDSMFGQDVSLYMQPNVCLELIWTETGSSRDDHLGKASKAFLTEDLCGQQYLCFMVPYKQHLRCLKFEESNDGSQLVFGSVTCLHAKDATAIQSQNMLLVLQTSGVLVLYSGTTKMSQVHIPILPLGSGSTSLIRSATTPLGSPTRGEVVTSSRPPSAMDARFDEQSKLSFSRPFARPRSRLIFTKRKLAHHGQMTGISPVSVNLEDSACALSSPLDGGPYGTGGITTVASGMVTPGNSFIQNLRDNVGSRFSVELLNGNLFRTELPPMASSPGIDLCLRALKHLLPRDWALQLLARWYSTRNSAGASGELSEWDMFTSCLLISMGYDTSKLALTSKGKENRSTSPEVQSKRARPSDNGEDEDWDYLINSSHNKLAVNSLRTLQLFPSSTTIPDAEPMGSSDMVDLEDDVMDGQTGSRMSRPCAINSSATLFTFCPAVLLALHMAYEEMKLNILLQEDMIVFAPLIHQIASDLRCDSYADYYRRDFPHLFGEMDDISQISEGDLRKMQYPHIFPASCPTVLGWIHQALRSSTLPQAMPYIPGVGDMTSKIISLYAVLVSEDQPPEMVMERCLKKIAPAGHRAPTSELSFSFSMSRSLRLSPGYSQPEKLVIAMTEMDITQRVLDCLPVGVSLPLREACLMCRSQPPSDWPEASYKLIGRQDLSDLASLTPAAESYTAPHVPTREKERDDAEKEEEDGMEYLDEEVLKLRFPKDLRVQEVRKLLQSSRPVPINLKQLPEISDHLFLEKQEKLLLAKCVRTMALSVGRGILTLHTCQPLLTETLPIPKLCLTGKASPRNTTVDLTRVDVPTNMSVWPQFHNGVAAGLRITDTTEVGSSWIIYNRPKELTNGFAGFLMALGLNGHLLNLSTFSVHEYICEGNELVAIGLLLGMAAAKRGTMDHTVTKTLSVHISPLLPLFSMELNISHNTRVAAVMGIGLLYQGTGHMHMAEVMLTEIGRPPGPEMENCIDRDSYSLSAGLSLGLIMFGRGNQTTGLSDLSMADLLRHLMVGGHAKQMLWSNRDRMYRAPSYLIKEGDRVNVDVTSPGATLALGMIFFNTGNSAVSEWLKAPDTQFMLDQVRPDFLCLRTISYGLVNWSTIMPSIKWINSNVPEIVFRPSSGEDLDLNNPSLDVQTMSQAHCNITCGACLVMAFKFAGSGNSNAFKAIFASYGQTMKLLSYFEQNMNERCGRSLLVNTGTIKLLALAIVMAGTGNLVVLKLCRNMRRRVGPQYQYVTYGNHMCIAMAIGLLFMGGGKFSLKTTPEAIGAMVCAFYPHFPISSTDNKFHLQAFRHLYVLACEPRLIIPRDVDTGKFCFVPLRIKFKGCQSYKSVVFSAYAPYILPELSKIEEIQIIRTRYWPILFRDDKNWKTLKLLLSKGGVLSVKQRAGHLSYQEDLKGYRSAVAKSLINDHSCHFSSQLDVVKSFTSDAKITALTEHFITQEQTESEILQELNAIIYQCVTQEKAEAISPYIVLKHLCQHVDSANAGTWGLQQLQVIQVYYSSSHRFVHRQCGGDSGPGTANCKEGGWDCLLHTEFLLNLRCRLESDLRQWLNEHVDIVLSYLRGQPIPDDQYIHLAQAVVWFSLPNKTDMINAGLTECPPIPVLASIFPQLNMAGLRQMHKILKAAG